VIFDIDPFSALLLFFFFFVVAASCIVLVTKSPRKRHRPRKSRRVIGIIVMSLSSLLALWFGIVGIVNAVTR
jgi:predicted membrane metal-binding protein